MSGLSRQPGRYVVRGWQPDGRQAIPVYTDDPDEARSTVGRLCARMPGCVFSASDTVTGRQLASAHRGDFQHH